MLLWLRASIPAVEELEVRHYMISLTTILLLLIAVGTVWALIDLFFVGSRLTRELRRWLRAKHTDYLEIDLPADLAIAVANG